jgi:tetratricopeptide (TPR) repeat protein
MLQAAAYLRRKEYGAALDILLQVHEVMPNNARLMRLIATIYGALSGWADQELEGKAVEWGERAVEASPELVDLHAELGWDWIMHSDYERAYRAFSRALELDPCCEDALRGLAALWPVPENEGEQWVTSEEMIQYLKRAAELAPHNPSIPHWLASELLDLGRVEEAQEYLLRSLLSFTPLEEGFLKQWERFFPE